MSYNLKKIQKLKRITAKKKTIVEQISHPPKLDGVVFRRNKIIIFVIKSPQISAKLNIFWVEEEIEDSLAVIFLFVLKQTFVVNLQRSHAKNSFLPYLMDLTPWSGLANKFVTFRFFLLRWNRNSLASYVSTNCVWPVRITALCRTCSALNLPINTAFLRLSAAFLHRGV